MKKNLGSQLQDYATMTPNACQHPINKVDENNFCHACNTQLEIKTTEDKDALLRAARIALTFYRKWMANHDGTQYPYGIEIENRIKEVAE